MSEAAKLLEEAVRRYKRLKEASIKAGEEAREEKKAT